MLAAMREIIIDCAGVTSTEGFWQRYLDVAEPDGAALFGRNLDAFWDAIEHGGPGWPGEAVLVFRHSDQLAGLRTAGGGSLLDALGRIADRASRVSIRLL
ncbi:hypothetical protein CSW64_10805 [Caulobacter mirabilis]|uniref:Barstar (barnase inhibitor) domain-containing protein n=2 Tax=Caulobacter mirabilis TaxID=69666 RepID=A0A2D2AXX5_9CAUL|nr:hypothetical protein CSW64_10805 [Caulobacter mirabilis]